ACRSPRRRLLRCFLSDYPSFSNRLSAPCRLADGRFLAFRLGSRFCHHGCLPDAHCIWKVFVRSLPNKKVSQQARRLPSTIDRRQASTAGETSKRSPDEISGPLGGSLRRAKRRRRD